MQPNTEQVAVLEPKKRKPAMPVYRRYGTVAQAERVWERIKLWIPKRYPPEQQTRQLEAFYGSFLDELDDIRAREAEEQAREQSPLKSQKKPRSEPRLGQLG
jgi:hypothetical protein